MKKEKLLKLAIALIMGIVLLVSSVEVFALSDSDTGLDFFEDQSDQLEVNSTDTDKEEETNINKNTNTNTNTNNNTANNYNTNLPKAGVAENTLAGVAITVLAITAIYAYRKVSEYRNI